MIVAVVVKGVGGGLGSLRDYGKMPCIRISPSSSHLLRYLGIRNTAGMSITGAFFNKSSVHCKAIKYFDKFLRRQEKFCGECSLEFRPLLIPLNVNQQYLIYKKHILYVPNKQHFPM